MATWMILDRYGRQKTVGASPPPPPPTTVSPSSIASAESFGTSTMRLWILPSSIGSAEAFGVPSTIDGIVPDSITSAEAFGTPRLTRVIGPGVGDISSGETFGSPHLFVPVAATSITSAEAFGTPTIVSIIKPSSIGSAEAFGSPTVTSVDDPPVISMPANQSVHYGVNGHFTSGDGTDITVADPDDSSLTIDISVDNSIHFLLNGVTGLSFNSGANGTSAMNFTGTITDINTAMDGSITSTGTFTGTYTITVSADDGHGGTDSDIVTVTVAACGNCFHGKCIADALALTRNDSLLAWWLCLPASTGTTFWDLKGGRDSTWSTVAAFGATSRTGGYQELGLGTSWASGRVPSANPDGVWDQNADWSLSCFTKWSASPGSSWWEEAIVAHDEGGGGVPKWIFSYDTSATAMVFHWNGQTIHSSTFTPTTATWYHFGLKSKTVTGTTTWTFYVDGVPFGTAVNNTAMPGVNHALTFGWGEGTGAMHGGAIDDVQIHTRALTDQEFADIVTDSGNGYGLVDC